MSWDFETDPEFQRELDWVDAFVRDEVEPLDFVVRHAWDMQDPARQQLIPPLQDRVRERGLWAAHLGPHLGGAGFGQVKLALLNEILGRTHCGADRVRLPGARLRERRDPRALRHGVSEAHVPRPAAAQRHRVGIFDDRTARWLRPDAVRHPRRARRRRMGHQRREVVLLPRQLRDVPHRARGHRPRPARAQQDVDVRGAGRHAGRADRQERAGVRPPRRPRHAFVHPL